MNYPCTELIKNMVKSGSKYGLSRTRSLLDALGSPDKSLKIIHIAGTNGKGSTAAFVSQILVAAGKKVGAFTSPEVYFYNERFALNCKPAPSEIIEKYLKVTVDKVSGFTDKPTAFEIETAAALYMFLSEGCEYAVVECGLGGKDDATNAIANKEVAIITSVSLEHTQILGNTVSEICAAKAGIVKGCPLVVSALQCDEGREYFLNSNAIFAGEDLKITSQTKEGQSFTFGGKQYKIGMHGYAQCYNAATAATACALLGIDETAIRKGLAACNLSGRLEIVESKGVTYLIDGSHNPASFYPLVECAEKLNGVKALVFGCLSDKDVEAAAEILCPHFCSAELFAPDSYRAMDIEKIQNAFMGKIAYRTHSSVEDALVSATGNVVAVCGSFTFLSEAKRWIEKRQ